MARLEDTTFNEIGKSGNRMHGYTAVLVSGASVDEQNAIRTIMDEQGLDDVRSVFVRESDIAETLDDLCQLEADSGRGQTHELPRAMIMSGLTDHQLHALMDTYRESGLPRPLWAGVTPTTSSWTFADLLLELARERAALREATVREQEKQNTGDD